MPRKPKYTVAELSALKKKGWTVQEIADHYGVTKQAISNYLRKYGGYRTPREKYLDHYPWRVSQKFTQGYPHRLLRDHAEYVATSGEGMSEEKIGRLRKFYRDLREGDLVVEYDPGIPPNPVSKPGGWAYRERLPSDGKLIIRVNEYTNLTEQGKRIWRFPRVEP